MIDHRAYLLWDASAPWGLMAWESCREAGFTPRPIGVEDVRRGVLDDARLLVMPGGWPALKKDALGQAGAAALRRFVENGGLYLGFCGGAGLALESPDGLGLVPLGRSTGKAPGLNGPILTRPAPGAEGHPLWMGQSPEAGFYIWWPGHFARVDHSSIRPLALYAGAPSGLITSGIPADRPPREGWKMAEKARGVALDPSPLWGRPGALEADLGRGGLLLSYLHLDTPGDPPGLLALNSLWRHWAGGQTLPSPCPSPCFPEPAGHTPAGRIWARMEELWGLGLKLGLWRPRHPAMPLWRRGARGLEMWTLYRYTRALCGAASLPGVAGLVDLEALAVILEPVFRHGPEVFRAQARRLAEGGNPGPAERAWFPRPRRTGGDMARAWSHLETALLPVAAALSERAGGVTRSAENHPPLIDKPKGGW